MRIGLDIQSRHEVEKQSTLSRSRSVFSAAELDYCATRADPSASLAGIFASKEAFLKATSGLQELPAIHFTDIQVIHSQQGRPALSLAPHIHDFLQGQQLCCDLSISHSADFAVACVLIFKQT